jgi:hypothetical protein
MAVQWQQIARAKGFKQTSPLLAVPNRLEPFHGDFVAELFSGRRLWVQTGSAYYSIQLKCPELIVTVSRYAVGSAHIETRVSYWRWVDDEVISLLSHNPIFVEAN